MFFPRGSTADLEEIFLQSREVNSCTSRRRPYSIVGRWDLPVYVYVIVAGTLESNTGDFTQKQGQLFKHGYERIILSRI